MKYFTVLFLTLFISSKLFSQPCVDVTLIDELAICPLIYDPVCGCNGVTYDNSCIAVNLGGVTSYTSGACASGGCLAAFTYSALGADIFLLDASTYPAEDLPVSWTWEFADGSALSGPVAIWSPPTTGEFEVCLTITTLGGCTSTSCQSVVVEGGGDDCEAAFNYEEILGDILLTDASVYGSGDLPSSWTWEISDGSFLDGPIVSWTPPGPGEFEVCLSIVTAAGCTSTYCEFIFVSESDCVDPTLIDLSIVCPTIFAPVCGCDGNTYSNDCVAQNFFGITSWTPGECGTASCTAGFDYSASSLTLNFEDQSESSTSIIDWIWDFGDGTTGTGANPTHTYVESGLYSVCLSITDETGCTNTICESIVVSGSSDCVDSSLIDFTVACPLIFDPVCGCNGVTYDNECNAVNYGGVTSWTSGICSDTLCEAAFFYAFEPPLPVEVSFSDNSTAVATEIVLWSWTFGDGGSSTLQDPLHTYTESGTYEVCLTIVTASGCTSEFCTDLTIPEAGDCEAGFTWSDPELILDGYEVEFTDESSGPVDSWAWDFGDGSSATIEDPSNVFALAGVYEVCLTVASSSSGCSDTQCDSIVIEDITPPCIDSSIIDLSFVCPTDYIPVCGCNDITYGNACKAENWYGVTSWTDGECLTGIEDISNFTQIGIFPNPFSDFTQVHFNLNAASRVRISVNDLTGREISILMNDVLAAGHHDLEYRPEGVPSGIYLLKMEAGTDYTIRKLVYLK